MEQKKNGLNLAIGIFIALIMGFALLSVVFQNRANALSNTCPTNETYTINDTSCISATNENNSIANIPPPTGSGALMSVVAVLLLIMVLMFSAQQMGIGMKKK